jgi:Tol biopolymer transport system component
MAKLQPAFSPDGGRVVFSRNSSLFLSDIYLLTLSRDLVPKGEPKRLTLDASREFWCEQPIVGGLDGQLANG